MMLDRESTLPIDLVYGHPSEDPNGGREPLEYVQWIREVIRTAQEYARTHMKSMMERQKGKEKGNTHLAPGYSTGPRLHRPLFSDKQPARMGSED